MKKSVYSSLHILYFTFAVVVGYQNCGAVGGTSPFSYDPGPETDPGDLESGNHLKLSLASAPTISGRELSVRFETC